MSGSANGGDDTLTGGDATGGSATNTLYGDAYSMSGSANGGDDTLTGGDATPGTATNTLSMENVDLDPPVGQLLLKLLSRWSGLIAIGLLTTEIDLQINDHGARILPTMAKVSGLCSSAVLRR